MHGVCELGLEFGVWHSMMGKDGYVPNYLQQVLIYQKLRSVTLFTISMCCSRKKGFRHLFTFIIKALTYTYVPSRLAHLTHSAPIV